jgi:hypothetical protein
MARPAKNEQTILPSGLIRIEVHPVTDDGALYYKTLIFDLEPDSKGDLRSTVRDIFHSDSPQVAVEILQKVLLKDEDGGQAQ